MEDVELRDDLPDPYALVEVPKLDALSLLQSIYNDPSEPKSLRVKCAIEALPTNVLAFEPQRASIIMGEDFGARLERAIERSGVAPEIIEATPAKTIEAASIADAPPRASTVPDRRFRRA